MFRTQLAICAVAIVWIAASAQAQEPASSQPTAMPTAQATEATASDEFTPPPSPDSVDEDLVEAKARPAGIFKYGPVSLIDPVWKKLNETTDKIGLKVGLSYTVVFQQASGGPGMRQAAGGDFDLFGDWRLIGPKGGDNIGSLYFAAENRHEFFTEIPPASLGGQIGSLWGTTNGFNEQVFTLRELYWQQNVAKDRFIARVGKIDPENYYNSNYWQSDSKYFMNQAFSSFPARAFPSNGLGVNLTSKLTDQWYISTGFQDAQGRKTTAGFDTFFGDFNLFSALEVGFTPTIKNMGRGTYRATVWYRDAGETNGKPHDAGFDISFDQFVTPNLIPFFRAGIGEGNINGIEDMISAGIGWQGKLITTSDIAGVAGAWGRPSNHNLNDQFETEIFYRLQVSPDNQLTVGYQVIIDPVSDPGSDVVGVFELRWRVAM
jgi:porin